MHLGGKHAIQSSVRGRWKAQNSLLIIWKQILELGNLSFIIISDEPAEYAVDDERGVGYQRLAAITILRSSP